MAEQTTITPEQEAKLPAYIEKWMQTAINCDDINVDVAKKAIGDIYKVNNHAVPQFFFGPFNGPIEIAMFNYALVHHHEKQASRETIIEGLLKFANRNNTAEAIRAAAERIYDRMIHDYKEQKVTKKSFDLSDQVADQTYTYFDNMMYGAIESSWLCFYDFLLNETEIKDTEDAIPYIEYAKVGGFWIPLENCAIFARKAIEMHVDDRFRLHKVGGPALKFADGISDIYCLANVSLPPHIPMGEFGINEIREQENVEIRRMMIELKGWDWYEEHADLKLLAEDDFGKLFRQDFQDDVPIMLVKVINSSPEPDGTFKNYILRVDPEAYGGIKTPQQAIASTWRNADGSLFFKSPKDYDPSIET